MPGARIEVREGRNRELVTWNCSFARVRVLPRSAEKLFPADFRWSSSDQIGTTTLHSMNIYVHKSVIYGVLLCITPLRCPTEIVHPVMIDESTSNSAKSAASSARTEPSMHTALALAFHHRILIWVSISSQFHILPSSLLFSAILPMKDHPIPFPRLLKSKSTSQKPGFVIGLGFSRISWRISE